MAPGRGAGRARGATPNFRPIIFISKMDATLYNQKGKEAGIVKLPEALFGVRWNADLVHQVYTSLESSRRQPIAHAKTRGEVSGGGKKPWRQKGTGRARHGSIRSPIWVGGGVAHGPRNDKNYFRKVNKKMKSQAFRAILSKKYHDGEILFVNNVALPEAKTKHAKEVLVALSTVKGFERLIKKKQNAAVLAIPKDSIELRKSFRNIGHIEVVAAKDLGIRHALTHTFLVLVRPDEFFSARLKSVEVSK